MKRRWKKRSFLLPSWRLVCLDTTTQQEDKKVQEPRAKSAAGFPFSRSAASQQQQQEILLLLLDARFCCHIMLPFLSLLLACLHILVSCLQQRRRWRLRLSWLVTQWARQDCRLSLAAATFCVHFISPSSSSFLPFLIVFLIMSPSVSLTLAQRTRKLVLSPDLLTGSTSERRW